MRDIKFRVWDKKQRSMRTVRQIDFSTGNIQVDHEDMDGTYYYIPLKNSLMQFTGLLDKNGKEIYEGDIIKGIGEGFTVIFQDGCFVGKYKNEKSWIDLRIFNIDKELSIWKILGNVYENPELLEINK